MDRRPTAAVGRSNRGRTPVTDGPVIVQSDKTLLLEVDHPRSREARHAIAPFAELERSPEHVHTYRLTPLGLWNARAAGHDAEQVIDALVRYSRYAVPHALLVDVTDTMDRYGRLRLVNDPAHGLVLASLDRAVLTEVVRSKKVAPMLGERLDDDTIVIHPSERGRLKQALLKLGWLVATRLPARGGGELLLRRLRRGGAALRRRQDDRRRGRDGPGRGDHADPGDEHRVRAAVAERAAATYHADRRRDRRVLRGAQGDPAGHHRDVPDHGDPAEGRVHPPGPVRGAGLGLDRVRRGAPIAGAGVPDDRGHPIAAPAIGAPRRTRSSPSPAPRTGPGG